MTTQQRRLAIFVAFSGTGGVERVVLNLLEGLSTHDIQVDLLAVIGKHGYRPEIPWPNIRFIDLGTGHTHLALSALVRYLRKERPDVLMAAKDRAIRIAILARWLSGIDTRLVGQLHATLSAALARKPAWQRWLRFKPMRWLFPYTDLLIGVSEGVAQDTRNIVGLSPERVVALPNPVVTPHLIELGKQPVQHAWFFQPESVPVIIAVGRLVPEKDFPTLIQAFALLRQKRDCRLLILGEGPLRAELEALVAELNLTNSFSMPGYVANPYAYMAKSSLFVLSSGWEGLPTVLIEALGLGVPVVSTDCQSGPREIMGGGQYGLLVPVGDTRALSEAMLATLDNPLPKDLLQKAAEPFTTANSTLRYLDVLGLSPQA